MSIYSSSFFNLITEQFHLLIYFFPLLFPFLNFFILFFFGRLLSLFWVIFLTSFSLAVAFCSSLFLFWWVLYNSNDFIFYFGSWFSFGSLIVNWSYLIDSIVVVMFVVVCGISFFVHLYSIDYMFHDLNLTRFLSYLSLFTFFMLMLVTAGNLVQLFLGWEGVGLSSYLLINFWYTRVEANKAAIKAVLLNRFGDIGVYLAIMGCLFSFQTADFLVIFSLPHFIVNLPFPGNYFSCLLFINCCLLIGAMGKSAQLGLHTWLPDAMEGPTPVSALIHAATMVTAGVFLLIRCSPLLEFTPFVLNCILWVGACTALFSATVGCFQNDIKKIIAYSTCSQLGYMFMACGLSGYSLALFHLFNHAFFKALLFLGAGSVIHALADEQDIRRMGGLFRVLPVTYITMLIGSLSLAGWPFFSGFYSKDLILELALVSSSPFALFAYWAGTLTVFLTSFYSLRLLYYVFWGSCNLTFFKIHESSYLTLLVLSLLSIASLVSGFLFKDLFVGFGSSAFVSSIFMQPYHNIFFLPELLDSNLKLIPLWFSLGGIFTAFFCYYCVWPWLLRPHVIYLPLPGFFLKNMFFIITFSISLIFYWYDRVIRPILFKIFFFGFERWDQKEWFKDFADIRFYCRKLGYWIYKWYRIFVFRISWRLQSLSEFKTLNISVISIIVFIRGFYRFFNQKWFFDIVYNKYFVFPVLSGGYHITFKLIDRGLLELFGPLGLVRLFNFLSLLVRKFQSGYIFMYIFWIFSFAVMLYFVCMTRLAVDYFYIYFMCFFLFQSLLDGGWFKKS